MKVFQDYAYYYNVFYQDKDYAEESRQVDTLLKLYGSNIHKIINYGCGTGRHDIELSKLGYDCTGIDMSPLMIEIAQKNSKNKEKDCRENGNFLVADIRAYEAKEKYDAVISLFHVMSYQNSNDDIVSTFRSARKALHDGGLFVFDLWYGPGVLSDPPTIRVKEVQDDRYKLVRIARPVMHDKTNMVDVCYEVLVIEKETDCTKTINETHHMRYFFRPELEFYLKESGFKLIDNLDCKTLGETRYDSWTSYFVAEAI